MDKDQILVWSEKAKDYTIKGDHAAAACLYKSIIKHLDAAVQHEDPTRESSEERKMSIKVWNEMAEENIIKGDYGAARRLLNMCNELWKDERAMFYLNMKLLSPEAKPFEIGRDLDAGYDIFSIGRGFIPSKGGILIDTGIATEFADGYVGLIFDRSSTGIKGLMRRAGVIDSGYRGMWRVSLFNSTDDVITFSPDKAIAQVVFVQYAKRPPEIVEELEKSERGETGYGSTDKKA
jgi:dUTP pyrophosphatase